MAIHEDPPPSVPEWVFTYGDMMSLILVFFIMIVSMSELKKNDKFQGVADAMEQQFGTTKTANGTAGGNHPRRTVLASLVESGRARRELALAGGDLAGGGQGSVSQLTSTASEPSGVMVALHENSLSLTDEARSLLTSEAEIWHTTKPTLEIRGYATSLPANSDQFRDAWDLAYERARVVARFLMEDLHFDAERIRVTAVGAPTNQLGQRNGSRKEERVEVIVQHDRLAKTNPIPVENAANKTSLKWK